jgi:hypothetical protein
MAYFKIEEPNKPVKWIKKVNGENGTLEFTEKKDDAYYQDSGFFADSEKGFLEFHFMDSYPELQYMTIDNGYRRDYLDEQQALPNDPQEIGFAGVGAIMEDEAEAPAEIAWE